MIRLLFKSGAKIASESNVKNNPILNAISQKNKLTLKELLSHSSEVKKVGYSSSPIIEAIEKFDVEAVYLLVEAGENLEKKVNGFIFILKKMCIVSCMQFPLL